MSLDRQGAAEGLKTVFLPWFLLFFGMFTVVYKTVTGDNLFPVYDYGELQDYTLWEIPYVYILNYATRAWGTLLFAFMLGGIIAAFVPKEKMKKYLTSKNFSSYVLAALLAPAMTVCSCAMIPIFGGLVVAGAGVGPAVTFLLMAPAANFIAIITTIDIISLEIAVARVVFAFFAAILVGYLVSMTRAAKAVEERFAGMAVQAREDYQEYRESFARKSSNALYEAGDLLKKVVPYLALGLLVVSYVDAFLPPAIVAQYLTGITGVGLSAVLGVPLYTPTLVEIFLIRALLDLGMAPAAALAFLIAAPMASIPSMLGVASLVGRRLVINYALLSVLMAFVAGSIYLYIF